MRGAGSGGAQAGGAALGAGSPQRPHGGRHPDSVPASPHSELWGMRGPSEKGAAGLSNFTLY